MAKEKSIIVLGGGISGLVAGGILAKEGFRVRLLEANPKLGGCAANTCIDGYTFHDGAVFLVMRSVLERVFERLGLDFAELLPVRRVTASSTTWLPDGSVVTHHDGLDISVDGSRPCDTERTRRELEALVDAWAPLYRALTEDLMLKEPSARRMLARTWRQIPRLVRSAGAELRGAITDPAVRSALAGTVLYSGVPAKKAPSMGLLGLIAALMEGTWLPEGGMGAIPSAIAEALHRHGGEITLDAPVDRIVVEDGVVRGVEVRGHGKLDADVVLSSLSALTTFGRLIDPRYVPRGLQRKVRSAALSQRAVSIQLGLRNRLDVPTYGLNVLPHMDEQTEYFASGDDETRWLAWTVPTAVCPGLAANGGSVVEMFPPIRQDLPPSAWDEARKQKVVDAALEKLSRHHRLDVAVCRVRGPGEFERQMHLPEGALYGLSTATSPLSMFPHRAPISGLYHAGQTTFPGYSVPASAAGGLLAAEAIRLDAIGAAGSRAAPW